MAHARGGTGRTRGHHVAQHGGRQDVTYLMFAMFAMTTDSVGIIIPEVIRTFQLSLTAAGTFQHATMTGIALAGLMLGQLADRFGRRPTIVIGLTAFRCRMLSSLPPETRSRFSR